MFEQYADSKELRLKAINLMKNHIMRRNHELEDALITACSCAAAGVPISDIFVQEYVESSFTKPLQHVTLIGFDPMPCVKTMSTIYRLV
ncbi:hypothetical protein NVP1191O_23 [Vibrio phage 1.191.O._10N.286.52.B4]|nr:hypothetical protein NVP1191O_23 [Vibrio phage 1.191.O._10N.286.52.B4]